jgi:ABC-type Fe3+-hydroxamate transport system substrate-binding protein
MLIGFGAAAQTPDRVASLVPGATEVLFAIGAGERVVGVGDYDDYPPAVDALPRLGGLVDPNLEAILAVHPDLVVIDPAQRGLAAQLAAAGIATYEFATGSIEAMLDHTVALGAELGVAADAAAVRAQVEVRLAAIEANSTALASPSVLVVFGRRPGTFAELWVSGGEGFLHDVVEIAGGVNVFADVARQSFKSGLESVLARVPDIVVEAVAGVDQGDRITAEWQALPGYAAVRVVTIDPAWALRPSPRVVDLAQHLTSRFHAKAARRPLPAAR